MRYELIKDLELKEELQNYFEKKIRPGDFCLAILKNNLVESLEKSDRKNLKNITKIISWLNNEAPFNKWGSHQRVEFHLKAVQKHQLPGRGSISEIPI